MSLNSKRKELTKLLNQNYLSPEFYYVYLEDEKKINAVSFQNINDFNNCVSTKTYKNKKYIEAYVNIGDWNYNYHTEKNILLRDVDSITKKLKNLKFEDRRKASAGFIYTYCLLYQLIIDSYLHDENQYIQIIDKLFIPSKIIISFFEKLEFFLTLNTNLLYFIKKIIEKVNIKDFNNIKSILLFKTGYPKFSYFDLNIIMKKCELKFKNEKELFQMCENLEKEEFLNYLNVCLDYCEFINNNNMIILKKYNKNNILNKLFFYEYENDEYIKLKEILVKYKNLFSDKITIEIDDYFSEKERKIFENNKIFL